MESRLTTYITFKPQPPIEQRNVHTLLFSRESYSLLMPSQLLKHRLNAMPSQQLGSQISWEYNSQCAIPHSIDQMVVTDANFVVAQLNVAQNVS